MSVAPQTIEGGRDGIGSGDSYAELRRIPLPRTPMNKAYIQMHWGLWDGILRSWLAHYAKLTREEHTHGHASGLARSRGRRISR
jgi:hypothetical protein